MVCEQITSIKKWAESAGADRTATELEATGKSSQAWQGYLEDPHPHQRHLFDLHTLRLRDSGANVAVEQLYRWAVNKKEAMTDDGAKLDYSSFVRESMTYLSQQSTSQSGQATVSDPLDVGPNRLAARVVDYFVHYFTTEFQDKNLFELLRLATPRPRGGQSRDQQIVEYLMEHLDHIRGVTRTLIAFEPQLSPQGPATLNTSVYLGMHWRDGAQKALLDQALRDIGPIALRNSTATTSSAIDPHRLQVSFGQHAFSLSMIRDFYLNQSSAMGDYLTHQDRWEKRTGPPVHASGEMQRLVTQKSVLYCPDQDHPGQLIGITLPPLPQRVVRSQYQSNPGGRGSGSDMLR